MATIIPAPPLSNAAAGTPSLRSLGTGATQAAAGNDSRITGAIQSTEKGAASGVATLDGSSKLTSNQLPTIAESAVTNLTTDLAAKEVAANKNQAGGYAGLDGSSKLTGSQQVYGTAANTACQGNDSRLSDNRTDANAVHVTGSQSMAGPLNITVASGTGLAVTNNATVGGTLGVTGALTAGSLVSGDFDTSGASALTVGTSHTTGITVGKSGITTAVAGDLTVGGTLYVTGLETLVAGTSFGSTVNFGPIANADSGNTTKNSILAQFQYSYWGASGPAQSVSGFALRATPQSNAANVGDLSFLDAGTTERMRVVAGTSKLLVNALDTLSGGLTITPATTVSGNLTVGSSKFVVTASSGATSVAGLLTLNGGASVTAGQTLALAGTTTPITLNSSAGTSGQVLTSAGAGATPTWTSPGTTDSNAVHVTGSQSMAGPLNITVASGTGLAVTKDATIGGTLGVTGSLTMSNGGSVASSKTLTMDGATIAGGTNGVNLSGPMTIMSSAYLGFAVGSSGLAFYSGNINGTPITGNSTFSGSYTNIDYLYINSGKAATVAGGFNFAAGGTIGLYGGNSNGTDISGNATFSGGFFTFSGSPSITLTGATLACSTGVTFTGSATVNSGGTWTFNNTAIGGVQFSTSSGIATPNIQASGWGNSSAVSSTDLSIGTDSSKTRNITIGRAGGQTTIYGQFTPTSTPGTSVYAFTASDLGTTMLCNGSYTIYCPTDANLSCPVGSRIDFIRTGTSSVSFLPQGGGAVLQSKGGNRYISAQWVAVSVIKTASNEWTLIGDLSAS